MGKKISQIKAGAMISYVSMFLGIAINLVYTPFILRTLGATEYGMYSLVNSTIQALTILGFGFESSIIRYTAKYRAEGNKEKERRLQGMFFIIYSIIGVVALIIGFILSAQTDKIFAAKFTAEQLVLTKKLMYLASFNIAITFPFAIFSAISTAYERFVFTKGIQALFRNLLNPALMTLVLLFGIRSVGMIVVATVINLLLGTINTIYCFKNLKIRFSFKGFNGPLLKEIIGFSFFVFLGLIVERLYWSSGPILLGMLSGAAVITYFNLGVQLNNYYQMLSSAISGLFLPRVTAMCSKPHTNRQLTDFMIKVGRIQFFVLGVALLGFMLIGQQFVLLWGGKGAGIVYPIALTLFIPMTVPLVQNVGISILQAKNKHAFRAISFLILSICNIFLSIPLIHLYGAYGPALSIAISYTAGQIITMNIYYHKAMKLNMFRFWNKLLRMLPAMLIPFFLVKLIMKLMPLGGGVLSILVYGGLFVCLYVLFMLAIGLNANERRMFMAPVKRILHMR